LDYLENECNYSVNTVTAYREDLEQFRHFLTTYYGTSSIALTSVDHVAVRHFLGELLEEGFHKSSIARKLTCLRTFFKFLLRKIYQY